MRTRNGIVPPYTQEEMDLLFLSFLIEKEVGKRLEELRPKIEKKIIEELKALKGGN